MNSKSQTKKRNAFYGAIIILGISMSTVGAVTHTVQFGVSGALAYSPSSFSANVGDTVTWVGDFSMHPLSSTTIPSGAASFHNTSGTTPYSYVITVAGTYNYQCDFHFSVGMTGSFTVTTVGVIGSNRPIMKTKSLTLQTFSVSNTLFLKIQSSQPEILSVKLFSALGKELISIPYLHSGSETLPITLPKTGKGLCILKVISREETQTRMVSITD
jgi:plastocyanin